MKKQVMITVKGEINDGCNRNKTEFLTKGTYEFSETESCILYQESDEIGSSGITTCVQALGRNTVIMTRDGGHNTNFIIEKGVRHHCLYDTSFGHFLVGISTYTVKNSLTDSGGELSFFYSIDVDNSVVSENRISIVVHDYEADNHFESPMIRNALI